ncbi:chemotaxis protein CheW [Mangrovibacillus cuniculi]|uniref:Purine-binding chemotaxis protein CheW n=1 Tax=Mangrovibacillus cuniculi TaxID=2593652 RepID=A0A7S8HFT9_9BACI|nr:chemotaxis protein CheW [Mangrovibacillus cuniculi]QPC46790.1 purine-binding chemotaxis protein CheW [Mangrovibacillus cuniculi]
MSEMKQYIVVNVKSEEYAIAISDVQSIEKVPTTTHIPQLPSYMVGICTIREDIIPVLDLRNLLYGEIVASTTESQLILVSHPAMTIGLLADSAKEILSIQEDQINQVGLTGYHQTSYMKGVIRLDQRLVTILDTSSWFANLNGMKEIIHYMEDYTQEQVK